MKLIIEDGIVYMAIVIDVYLYMKKQFFQQSDHDRNLGVNVLNDFETIFTRKFLEIAWKVDRCLMSLRGSDMSMARVFGSWIHCVPVKNHSS